MFSNSYAGFTPGSMLNQNPSSNQELFLSPLLLWMLTRLTPQFLMLTRRVQRQVRHCHCHAPPHWLLLQHPQEEMGKSSKRSLHQQQIQELVGLQLQPQPQQQHSLLKRRKVGWQKLMLTKRKWMLERKVWRDYKVTWRQDIRTAFMGFVASSVLHSWGGAWEWESGGEGRRVLYAVMNACLQWTLWLAF